MHYLSLAIFSDGSNGNAEDELILAIAHLLTCDSNVETDSNVISILPIYQIFN